MNPVWRALFHRLPFLVFILVYFITCYIGAIVLLFGPKEFSQWYLYFSGARLPDLFSNHLITLLGLLHLPPLVMWLGYETALRKRKWSTINSILRDTNSFQILGSFYILSFIFALYVLIKANSFSNLQAWVDYNKWIHARMELFSSISFFGFVNIYSILPLSVAYLVLSTWSYRGKFRVPFFFVFIGTFLASQILIFQKKSLLSNLIFLCLSLYVYLYGGDTPRRNATIGRHLLVFAISTLSLYMLYTTLVVVPVVRQTSQSYQPSNRVAEANGLPGRAKPLKAPSSERSPHGVAEANGLPGTAKEQAAQKPRPAISFAVEPAPPPANRNKAVLFYALMAPLTRTSAPAISYPVVYPREHPYYRLDLGQDILGFGSMPDDNLIVWNKLWPTTPGGTTMAPYHFVLYAQGGFIVSLVGAFFAGLLLGMWWRTVVAVPRPSITASLLAGLCFLFGIYLALDSARNSIVSSYGLIWPVLTLLGLSIIGDRLQKWRFSSEEACTFPSPEPATYQLRNQQSPSSGRPQR